jgi:hypothetical protein
MGVSGPPASLHPSYRILTLTVPKIGIDHFKTSIFRYVPQFIRPKIQRKSPTEIKKETDLFSLGNRKTVWFTVGTISKCKYLFFFGTMLKLFIYGFNKLMDAYPS